MIISSYSQLKSYLKLDLESYRMSHPWIARFTFGEHWENFSYVKNLRYLEWHFNNITIGNFLHRLFHKIAFVFRWLIYRYLNKKRNIYIPINCVGPGFHIVHRGYRYILDGTQIGKNCEILPMVLMGKKSPNLTDFKITIGDNCYISTGVTILGPVSIGDNVTIGAGAVITKDIPSGSTVVGVPGKCL